MFSRLPSEIASFANAHKAQYKAMRKAIEDAEIIVVFRHLKPDFDAQGSQMGLYTYLKDNFPEKEIHYVGDNHVSFTPRIFPETEKLNEAWFDSHDFLAIVLDVGDADRIANPHFSKAKKIIKIDHHPCKKEIATPDLTVCQLGSASAAELVLNFMASWKGKTISKEAARWIYIGIVGDSGRFQFSSTSIHTFQAAEICLNTGFDLKETYLTMYEKTVDSLKSLSYVLSNFKVSAHGVAYYTLPKEVQEELHITPELGKEHVNTFSNIAGVEIWCSITEDPNPADYCWRISIRSKGLDISTIANKWGGGGHKQASGARIDHLSDLDNFIKDLDDLIVANQK